MECNECNAEFDESDLIEFNGKHICGNCKETYLQKVREGMSPATPVSNSLFAEEQYYSDGKHLIVRHQSVLPHRCIHCNQPGLKQNQLNLTYLSPWWYLLIIPLLIFSCVGILIFIGLSILIRKKVTFKASVCEYHNRFSNYVSAFVIGGIILCFFGLGIFFINTELTFALVIGIGGLLVCVISIIISNLMNQVRITKITGQYYWVKGMGRDFLDSLPRWHTNSF